MTPDLQLGLSSVTACQLSQNDRRTLGNCTYSMPYKLTAAMDTHSGLRHCISNMGNHWQELFNICGKKSGTFMEILDCFKLNVSSSSKDIPWAVHMYYVIVITYGTISI